MFTGKESKRRLPACSCRVGRGRVLRIKPFKIRNSDQHVICPLAWTAQLENFQQAYPEAFEANVKMPPAGHYGDVEKEIGRVCVQLASPDFKYMNGETLTLEGGMGLRP